jgi:hypothetical protein
LALSPTTSFVGGVRSDATNTLWGFWFVAESLARGALPLRTVLLDHPEGGRLLVADPLNSLLAVPLTWMGGPVLAWAVLAPLHVALAGRAAHALAERLGGNGWIAGLGYAGAPIVVSHLQNGSSEAVSTGWLPLAALGLLEAASEGGLRRVLFGALGLTACSLGGWYAGVGAFLLGGCALAATALGTLLGDEAARAPARRLAASLALGVVLTAPMAAGFQAVANAPDGLVDIKNEEDLARIRRTLGPADPRAFFVPGDFRAPDFAALPANPSDRVHTTYLGWGLVLLACGALVRGRPEAPAGLGRATWAAAGFLAGLLALGPQVVCDGMPLAVAGRGIPLPYALLERLPGFGSLSLVYRLSTLSALALAVIASQVPVSRRLGAALALLPLFELRLASPVRGLPHVSSLPSSPALEALATAPPGGVLNLPVQAGRNYLWEQVLHEKPLAGSLNSGANRAGLAVVRAARDLRRQKMPAAHLVETARAQGIRYLVLHRDVLADEAFVDALGAIREGFQPWRKDERVVIYALW